MIHGCVTLDDVFAAASVRAASLVPETSGYLALAVGDATYRLPFAIDDRMVTLTTEGNVGITKRGEVLPPSQAAAGLRNVLARLLAISTGTAMPALAGAGRTREESDRGVDAVVEEIEAALIPVNRAAARRALARLARETIRAKETGKVKPQRAMAKPAAMAPQAAPKPAAPAEAPKAEPAKADPPKAVAEAPRPAAASRPPVEPAKPRLEEAHIEAPPPPVAAAPREPPPKAPPVAAPPRELTPKPLPVVAAPRVPTPRAPVAAPRELTPKALPVVQLPRVAIARPEPMPQLAIEVITPPPADVAPVTSLSLPVVILPTPPPVPVYVPATPPPPVVDLTPTLLGMGAVEVEGPPPEHHFEIVGAPTISVDEDEEAGIETIQAPRVEPRREVHASEAQAEAVAAPVVLAQPSEAPDVAFGLPVRAPRAAAPEALTPPFTVDVEPPPRALPAARAASPRFVPAPDTGSRADVLLARFGASCVDDAHMRHAAACLRHMAGIESTPAPLHTGVDASPEPETRLRESPARFRDLDAPSSVRARRGGSGMSFSLAIVALAVGIAGGAALVRFRPDLFGAVMPRVETRKAAPAAPAAAPAATAGPEGGHAPGWTPGGGARAERSTAERAR